MSARSGEFAAASDAVTRTRYQPSGYVSVFHSHEVAVSGALPVAIGRQFASPSRRASSVYCVSSLSGFSIFHLSLSTGLRGLPAESLSVGPLSLDAGSTVTSWTCVGWFCGA